MEYKPLGKDWNYDIASVLLYHFVRLALRQGPITGNVQSMQGTLDSFTAKERDKAVATTKAYRMMGEGVNE